MISLKNISKFYEINGQRGRNVLDNLSLQLPDKGLVVIFGASGCGKSTFLNILGGLDLPSSGSLVVSGRDTGKFTSADWDSYRNQEVGFIFQNYYLLPHLNVYENIAITLQMSNKTQDIREKINEAIEKVGLAQYKNRYPRTLSGGQQQRVAIARALISHPSLILADEPTGALDEENAIIVMDSLKKISEDHLVVMVTHNEKLAKRYADRFIELSYGTIKSDSLKENIHEDSANNCKLSKTHLPFLTNLKWSFRNVWKKKSRTIPTMIASGIGFMAVGLVVSMTVQVNQYTKDAQSASLSKYPVYVASYSKASAQAHTKDLTEYPTDSYVIVEKYDYDEQTHLPVMQKDFADYMAKMPKEYYVGAHSNSMLNFEVMSKSEDNEYRRVSSTSYMSKIALNYDFVKQQYDVITGTLPTKKNDILLLVDSYNRVDVSKLERLGFDISQDKIDFNQIIGKEFKFVPNDNYYKKYTIISPSTGKDTNIYTTPSISEYEDIYNDSSCLTLNIVGIIRPKTHDSSLFSYPLVYSQELSEFVQKINGESSIVNDQIKYAGFTKDTIQDLPDDAKVVDVFTGKYMEKQISGTYPLSINYQFQYILYYLGNVEVSTALYYYTDNFETRSKIMNYINSYKAPEKSVVVLSSRDYIQSVTTEFSGMVDTFSGVVFIFSLVAIFICIILTAVLTYISVLERTREIGLLRSLGARKKDVSFLFIMESCICGFFGGIIAIAGCFALAPTAGIVVKSLVSMFNSSVISRIDMTFNKFEWWVAPYLFLGSILVSALAALIPAIIAGNKKPADILKE